ncbi:hypothetical protein ACFFQF_00905 [Haladaptatus pallidirubidus]
METDELTGDWDILTTSASGIGSLPSNVSDGDVVRVKRPDTPYIVTSQIKFDGVDGLTIEFESPLAKDGNPIMKAADGADIGGFIFGETTACSDITVKNYGWDGNRPNQGTATRLHGITTYQVDGFTLDEYDIRRTSPQEHGSGGSGITIYAGTTDYTIRDGYIEDPGDRGIQLGGDEGHIHGYKLQTGYDRAIAGDAQRPDGPTDKASHVVISDCIAYDITDGTAFGFTQASDNISMNNVTSVRCQRTVRFAGNGNNLRASGIHAYEHTSSSPVYILGDATNVYISDVTGYSTTEMTHCLWIAENADDVTINGADLHYPNIGFRGITVSTSGTNIKLKNVTLRGGTPNSDDLHLDTSAIIENSHFECGTGINITANSADTEFIDVRNAGSYTDNGTGTIINGEAIESAAAETPQGSYPIGTFVDFTDSGDGSGTGYYRQKRDGSFVQVA